MKKHFVTFMWPGALVAEEVSYPISSWDTKLVSEMLKSVTEEYHNKPYGFYFSTRGRGIFDLDSKTTKKSPMYYLGGEVFTVSQIEERNNPDERILLSNMKGNHYERVIVNKNSWRWTAPLNKDDVVLDL